MSGISRPRRESHNEDRLRRKPRQKFPKWLQVGTDGVERWSDSETPRSLRVVLLKIDGRRVEQTWTRSRWLPARQVDGVMNRHAPVTPKGVGWRLHRDQGRSCVWRRPHVDPALKALSQKFNGGSRQCPTMGNGNQLRSSGDE